MFQPAVLRNVVPADRVLHVILFLFFPSVSVTIIFPTLPVLVSPPPHVKAHKAPQSSFLGFFMHPYDSAHFAAVGGE